MKKTCTHDEEEFGCFNRMVQYIIKSIPIAIATVRFKNKGLVYERGLAFAITALL